MPDVFHDSIDAEVRIGTRLWHVIEARVEVSRMSTPDYVDIIMTPDPQQTAPNLPSPIGKLIGESFTLNVDNELISERDTGGEETTLLFEGNLANISPRGENTYEAIAYVPAQQPFAEGDEDDTGNIMGQQIYLGLPETDYQILYSKADGVDYKPQQIKASELIQKIVEKLDITEYEIELGPKDEGIEIEGENGSYTGAFDRVLDFKDQHVTVKNALEKARESCKAEYWFDREGTFHFGIPKPVKHELRFITDTSAGRTTPPYQSVRVIGSGAASEEAFSRTNMEIEDKIEVRAALTFNNGDPEPSFGILKEPVFEYTNLEIATDDEAIDTATKIIEELGEQQSEGSISVVGFPEIRPFDGVIMPQAQDEGAPNYRENQPMGGYGYMVYKVVHKLNNSDGFITDITVGGVSGATKTAVSSINVGSGFRSDSIISRDDREPPVGGAEVR